MTYKVRKSSAGKRYFTAVHFSSAERFFGPELRRLLTGEDGSAADVATGHFRCRVAGHALEISDSGSGLIAFGDGTALTRLSLGTRSISALNRGIAATVSLALTRGS